MDSTHLLISRYLDGELTDEEVARLAAVLETDVASIDRLVFSSFIHAQLLNWMDQHPEQCDDRATPIDEQELARTRQWPKKISPIADSNKNSFSRGQPFVIKARRRLLSFGSLAAALLIGASISVVAYVIASRPVYVGQLTDATGCKWGASPAEIGVGTFLESGRDLELIEGRAVITFASGAKLFLEGPTSLRVNSTTEVHLMNGRLAAKVPRQAIGFTVASSLARFVDLGTAFTLTLNAEKSFALEVFEGLVELKLNKRFGEAVHKPAYVSAVHSITFDVNASDITWVPFEEGKKMPF
jgi:FecR protein